MASGGHILFGDFIIVTQFCGGHITVYAGFLPWSSHLSVPSLSFTTRLTGNGEWEYAEELLIDSF